MTLKAHEVLARAFEQALPNVDAEPLGIGEPVRALIADDSDDHRTRRGWMRYDELYGARVASRTYVLGLGESEGHYPARPYRADIVILSYQDPPQDLLAQALLDVRHEAKFFRRSFLIAMRNGLLEVPRRATVYAFWWEWPSPEPEGTPMDRLKAYLENGNAYDERAVGFVREALLGCLAHRRRQDIR